ncbi:MAG: endolytic transglycosylase MltG [Alphaproteobacteria bacterium]
MGRRIAGAAAALAIVVVIVLSALLWGRAAFDRPGPLTHDAVVVLPPGIGLDGIARELARAGVIGQPWLFQLGVRFAGTARKLQAGEFVFPPGISARGAMEHLVSGRALAHRLTVPEGMTSHHVVALIDATVGLDGAILTAPAEGVLLPETYHFSLGDSRAGVVRRMTTAMTETLAALWASRRPGLPFNTAQEALIMASMVEREASNHQERRHVAGVFVNRLARGMRLQSDPTVIYAVAGAATRFDHVLSRAELKIDSPYNTYRYGGLPAGPIANPGRDALAAVFDPLATKDLYFVSNGHGGLTFAATLSEHNRNVAKWRKWRDSQQAN